MTVGTTEAIRQTTISRDGTPIAWWRSGVGPDLLLVHGTTAGRERQFRVDPEQLARAVAQLADVGAAWDARLHRIRRIAEQIQRRADENGQQSTEEKQ